MKSSDPLLAVLFPCLRPALPGLFFAVLTLLFGFGLGVVFGLNEEIIKGHLAESAREVRATQYTDDAALNAALDKAWNYTQRAHLHAGGLGAAALGLIAIVVLLGTSAAVTRTIGLALGLGGLGYSMYWLIAGLRLPGLGSSAAAKASLEGLAIPSSGAFVAGTVAVAVLLIRAMWKPPAQGTPTIVGEYAPPVTITIK